MGSCYGARAKEALFIMGLVSKEIEIFGKKIKIETGKMAKQADGSAMVTCEGTSILATVVASDDLRPVDFLPLTVDVEEKLYAAGKIPGSFFRREGRPTDMATLTARIIDRTLRPNFDKVFRNDVQVVISVLSTDQMNPPDMLGIVGAACALQLSNIPFHGPLAGVRIGKIDGEWIVNPTFQEWGDSTMNLVVAGNRESILMVEAGSKEVSESEIIEGLKAGHAAIRELIDVIDLVDAEARREKGERPKKELIDEFNAYLTPLYKEVVEREIAAHNSGDSEEVENQREAYKEIVVEANSHFPDKYRKIVGICARTIGAEMFYNKMCEVIEPQIEESMRKSLLDASVPGLLKAERSLLRKDARKALGKP
jgi:polyribonucleotide nucleotidyltransferase